MLVEDGVGECLVVSSNPEPIRDYGYGLGIKFIIRQLDESTFGIWRIK